MRLTKYQIQDLYQFTRAHYVEHYDLQTELVDHLANGIEKQWKKYPNRSFEEAKQKEFKKFGVFGFMDVVAERQKAMEKRYWKIIFQFLKEFLRIPTVLLTLGLIFLCFIILKEISVDSREYLVLALLGMVTVLMLIFSFKRRKILKKKDKKWMLEEMLLNHAKVAPFFMLPVHFWNIKYAISSSIGVLIMSSCLVILMLIAYIILFVIPSKAEELLNKTYPEYKII